MQYEAMVLIVGQSPTFRRQGGMLGGKVGHLACVGGEVVEFVTVVFVEVVKSVWESQSA